MDIHELQKIVHKTRDVRRTQTLPKYSPAERDTLIKKYHPDHRESAYRPVKFGPNAGDRTVRELAALLEGESPVPADLDLTPNYTTDVLVVGGGGAGCAAALHAHANGAKVTLATKLRLGDSNTVMAQGGIQVAVTADDSPVQHFLDTLKGGHMKNDHDLLKVMVEDGPSIAKWLLDLGVLFDRDADGNLHVKKGGGSSKPRLLTCSDYTGLEIMRVLKDEVLNQKIPLLEFSAVVELLSDGNGTCTGAVLRDLDNKRLLVVAAKSVILATGGIGRLHIQGFPTSNHYGATGDGLALAYRLGAKLLQIEHAKLGLRRLTGTRAPRNDRAQGAPVRGGRHPGCASIASVCDHASSLMGRAGRRCARRPARPCMAGSVRGVRRRNDRRERNEAVFPTSPMRGRYGPHAHVTFPSSSRREDGDPSLPLWDIHDHGQRRRSGG